MEGNFGSRGFCARGLRSYARAWFWGGEGMAEGPVLVCGATGELGGRVARRLRAAGVTVRALVRPRSDGEPLRALGVEVVSGDFRDRASLERATVGVRAVVSTVTVIARAFAGGRDADFDD